MSRAGKRVLCIGTDQVNLNLRCGLLKKKGWDVASAGSGHDGLFRFKQGGFNAVILDLNTDGAEAALIASQLKRQDPSVCVIIIVTNPATLLPGATDQADAVVMKSEEDEVLDSRLSGLISNS